MFDAKTSEYFQGVCDHFLVPTSEIPEMIHLVFDMELLTIYSLPEAGSEHKVCFGASSRVLGIEKSPNEV